MDFFPSQVQRANNWTQHHSSTWLPRWLMGCRTWKSRKASTETWQLETCWWAVTTSVKLPILDWPEWSRYAGRRSSVGFYFWLFCFKSRNKCSGNFFFSKSRTHFTSLQLKIFLTSGRHQRPSATECTPSCLTSGLLASCSLRSSPTEAFLTQVCGLICWEFFSLKLQI